MSAEDARSKLRLAMGMCLVFMGIEIVGGLLAHSLAVLTDAAHLLSDVAGFAVSLFCLSLSERSATERLSFGFKRAEVIGALLSTSMIWVVTVLLLIEAYQRAVLILDHRPDYKPVNGPLMFGVATFGLCANMIILWVLGAEHGHSHASSSGGGGRGAHGHSHATASRGAGGDGGSSHGHSHDAQSHGHTHAHAASDSDEENHRDSHAHDDAMGTSVLTPLTASASRSDDNAIDVHVADGSADPNLNVTAAYVHALGDLAQSLAVMIAAGVIWFLPYDTHPRVQLVDPLATVLFSLFVIWSTVDITRTSLRILMQGVPKGYDAREIRSLLLRIPGVTSVHEVHFWSLSLNDHFFSCHVVADRDVLAACRAALTSMGINHASVQVEMTANKCASPSMRGQHESCANYGSNDGV